jgi:ATP-dependent exoDNAse (exonuclease V) beta subunit
MTGPAGRKQPPDHRQREAAVAERARNVLIDAGAGTGKTTLLVDRLVAMLAPAGDAPAVTIDRIAALTFTRKAAGELRLRIRERLLEELAVPGVEARRAERLRDALAGLDTAHVGTIHAFADRLLRLRPVESRLSPAYEIAEDDEALVHETYEVLLHAVQTGTLEAELAGTPAAARAAEAARWVLWALEAGVRAESWEGEWHTQHGLDGLVAGFLRARDVPPPDDEPPPFAAAAFHRAAAEIVARARPVRGTSRGARWLAGLAGRLEGLAGQDEPLVLFRAVQQLLDRKPRNVTKRDTFQNDDAAWSAWRALEEGLEGELRAPLARWLSTRLVRLFPVIVALHERVKARRQALDQLDLLVKLRDLLAGDRAVRAEFQGMFDHVFVDEFQDTDPLQAEIVLFLCEGAPAADRWEDVVLRDASLTLVGDPKQSIYRFRRADVAMYDRVRQVVARGPHLAVRLSANFRSVPPLIGWLNDCFERILGAPPAEDRPFDAATGRVFQQPLVPGREGGTAAAVQVLGLDFDDDRRRRADDWRALEGRALARYLRWLVERSGVQVQDPLDGRARPVRHGDVAVLAVSTYGLRLLFPHLDREGVPYASRGGTLFLADPLHRQLLLGLRAIADRDDGVAEAALLRPPFFAVDLADLARERAARDGGPEDAGVRRVREARDLVRDLRRRRFDRPPGATARDLLEETALGGAVALGPNGAQRLARLRELCLVLEQGAAGEGLDYDAVTSRLREWVEDPIQLDPPPPVGSEALQVLTVHQAKGLEFPVVVLWDGQGRWDARLDRAPWRMERDGRGWAMNLHGLAWEEPADQDLAGTEKQYLDAERQRVIYVAATRARDLLVVPRTRDARPGAMICADLIAEADPTLVRVLDTFRSRSGAAWAQEIGDHVPAPPAAAGDLEDAVAARWAAAAAEAARPRFEPTAVSGEAHGARDADEAADPAASRLRVGRFGSAFGHTVHRAIGFALRRSVGAEAAVARVTRRGSPLDHQAEAVADVGRALDALGAAGLRRAPGPDLRLEYPVAAAWDGGRLLTGYIDLVGVADGALVVLDFKTDTPPPGRVEAAYPEYARQVRLYGRLLEAAGLGAHRGVRCGLLFTGDGEIRWVETR